MVKKEGGLTSDGFNCLTGDRLANKIILNEAGGLRRDLHRMLRPFGPRVDHLCFRIRICGQTAKPHQCELRTVSRKQSSDKSKMCNDVKIKKSVFAV